MGQKLVREILCARKTYQLLSEDESIHFVGNVEARDLMDGVADVVVADGSRETLS